MKKNLIYILCLVFIGCNNSANVQNADEATTAVEKEWLVFDGDGSNAKEVVLISGDEEYRSEEALPQLARILSQHHGFKCTVLFAQDPEKPGIVDGNYQNNIPGLEALNTADLMIIFTRFRALPDNQMKYIEDYLENGKPVVGIRTSTHAFKFNEDSTSSYQRFGNYYAGDSEEWEGGFGRVVLGEKWVNHHGHHKHQSTKGIIAEDAKDMDITNGLLSGEIWGSTDVYGVRLPLPGDSQPIILGQVTNRAGEYDEKDLFYGMRDSDSEVAKENNNGLKVNDIMMPIAWTKSYQIPGGIKGRAFTSTIGSSSDLMDEGVRRLLINGALWTMNMPIPEKANVDLVGNYQPTAFGFKKDEYWDEQQMKISDLQD